VDESDSAIDTIQGSIDVGHGAPPRRVDAHACVVTGAAASADGTSEVWPEVPGPHDPGVDVESLSGRTGVLTAGYNGSPKRTGHGDTVPVTMPLDSGVGERGVMGAPRSRHVRSEAGDVAGSKVDPHGP
jgi:hypothetical protein